MERRWKKEIGVNSSKKCMLLRGVFDGEENKKRRKARWKEEKVLR